MLSPDAPGIDTELQAEIVANMHRYAALYPHLYSCIVVVASGVGFAEIRTD
jgi:hypothetical protein